LTHIQVKPFPTFLTDGGWGLVTGDWWLVTECWLLEEYKGTSCKLDPAEGFTIYLFDYIFITTINSSINLNVPVAFRLNELPRGISP